MANTKAVDEKGYRKFGMLDKLAYAAGDFGCNTSFALKGTLTIFWTQFMGIDEILMAGLLLAVQIWDAINDPLIGSIVDADHHKYKRNKFLAYISAGSIGLLVAGALCFVPWTSAPMFVKYILFVAGYIIWDAFYTVANVPYGSLLSLITDDPVERAQLSSWRSIGSMVASLSIQIILPFIIYDASNNLRGNVMIIIGLVLGIIGLVFFRFMIHNTVIRVDTEVRVSEDKPKEKFNFFVAMYHFLRNRPAVGAALAGMAGFLGMYGAQTAVQVLFQAYFKNAQISGIMGMISYVGLFVFMPFVKQIVTRFGKKEALAFTSVFSVVAYILMFVLPVTPDGQGLAIYVGCQLLAAVGNGLNSLLCWSLMADAMDYEEWKFGERHEGTTYALYSFFRKLSQGVGPSLGLVLATWVGYNADLKAAQPMDVATNLRYLTPAMYLFGAVLQFIAFALIYNLDKKTLAKMNADLEVRRANNSK